MKSKIVNFFNLLFKFEISKIIYNFILLIGFKKTSNLSLYLNYKFRNYNDDQIFFFHISKCAGTALRDVFNEINKNSNINILRFGHAVKSKHVNFSKKNRYVVNIREPLDRFLSAFYDRKRSKNLVNVDEIDCFKNFPDANKLAETLSANNFELRNKAIYAMKKIELVNHHYSHWFDLNFIENNEPFFIFEQENIEEDFKRFCEKINYNKNINLKIVNKNETFPEKPILTEKSINNLKRYLSDDLIIYQKLLSLKKKLG